MTRVCDDGGALGVNAVHPCLLSENDGWHSSFRRFVLESVYTSAPRDSSARGEAMASESAARAHSVRASNSRAALNQEENERGQQRTRARDRTVRIGAVKSALSTQQQRVPKSHPTTNDGGSARLGSKEDTSPDTHATHTQVPPPTRNGRPASQSPPPPSAYPSAHPQAEAGARPHGDCNAVHRHRMISGCSTEAFSSLWGSTTAPLRRSSSCTNTSVPSTVDACTRDCGGVREVSVSVYDGQ